MKTTHDDLGQGRNLDRGGDLDRHNSLGQATDLDRAGDRLRGRRILLGVTGGIAAYKSAELVRGFKKAGADVQVLMTRDAARFITPLTLGTLSEREVLTDIFPENASGSWTKHVHLGRWADLFLVAPATANTIAKLAGGFCDSMLTAVALSAVCPQVVCPAMDHDMYEHPATRDNLALLSQRGVEIMEAAYGPLASGLVGQGRLPEPAEILDFAVGVLDRNAIKGPLSDKHVLVTAGPTRENIDPVRFLSNRSTGTMGFSLAEAAAALGARVTLIAGPTSLDCASGIHRIDVESAQEMANAVAEHAEADIVVMAAAVADYTPALFSDHKIKKADSGLALPLVRTTDILATLGANRSDGQTLIGFALETENGEEHAQEKLERKNLDWIVLNSPNQPGEGFGTGTNRVTLISRRGDRHELPLMDKRPLAGAILERILAS